MFGEEEEGGGEELEEEAHFLVEELATVFLPIALKSDDLYFLQKKIKRRITIVTLLLRSTKFKQCLTSLASHIISHREWSCCKREEVRSCTDSQVTTIVVLCRLHSLKQQTSQSV